MEKSQKQDTQSTKETIWITYRDNDGKVKSAPLESFQQIAKKRNWKPEKQGENT